MRLVGFFVVPALALAACGKDSDTTTIKGSNGETVTIESQQEGDGPARIEATNEKGEKSVATFGGEGAWPADAPAHAAAYPGARVISVIASASGDNRGSIIAFESADDPARIIAHYKALAQQTGLGESGSMTAGALQMFTAADKATGREMMVQASTAEGKTQGSLTFATRAGN